MVGHAQSRLVSMQWSWDSDPGLQSPKSTLHHDLASPPRRRVGNAGNLFSFVCLSVCLFFSFNSGKIYIT